MDLRTDAVFCCAHVQLNKYLVAGVEHTIDLAGHAASVELPKEWSHVCEPCASYPS